ncbi:2'-5' RNA ligase family protein [Limosilactobacillus antri]|uniref:2',5' RNA ligase family protein n=1 Tax=Limosilactobacillus antri DSM 16041 TaxID=525309 RepID=C8P961_9LACO|nr:2'-5' RNA ligase family protein [Limosilactobacillus antri]EEW52967.1 hypothetical protein HMPREF0494_1855 [Limosilactobacillus antri DSM 16041]KRK56212.1 hypothetical protein FC31_GL001400 [Limosilactobacillus antri DSM 16041]
MEEELKRLYQSINDRGCRQLREQQVEIDDRLRLNQPDSRRGLTLLGRLPAHVRRNIEFSLQQLAAVAPDQYYYPSADLHITIMDLLAARDGWQISREEFNRYRMAVGRIVAATPAIHWQLRGLIVSPGAVLVTGDYGPELTTLRQRLRTELPDLGLPVAERYPTISGHVTVARFAQPLVDPARFLAAIRENAATGYGSFTMHSLDLVVHDWYNHQVEWCSRLPFAEAGR